MAPTSTVKSFVVSSSAPGVSSMSLLIELEGVALPFRSALFDIAKNLLAERGVELTPALFLRCNGPISSIAGQLLDIVKAEAPVSEFEPALFKALVDRLDRGTDRPNAHLPPLLEEAKRRGLSVAAVTGLPDHVAQVAYSASNLARLDVPLFSFGDEAKPFPRADAWLKAAKQLGRPARACIALAGSQLSCKTALAAGMRTVGVPDPFTAYQDFSGCDAVIESWEDTSPAALLDHLTAVPL